MSLTGTETHIHTINTLLIKASEMTSSSRSMGGGPHKDTTTMCMCDLGLQDYDFILARVCVCVQ